MLVAAAYDPELDTGYVYRRGDATVEVTSDADDGTYRVDDGDPTPASARALDRVRSLDVNVVRVERALPGQRRVHVTPTSSDGHAATDTGVTW